MATAKEIIAQIEKHKEEINAFGVKRLALFGSYARGQATVKSDVDFLVEFKQGRGGYDDYVGLLELLRKVTGKEVDLVKRHLVREELRPSILGGVKVEASI